MKKHLSILVTAALLTNSAVQGLCLKTYNALKDPSYPVFELWNKNKKTTDSINYAIGKNLLDLIKAPSQLLSPDWHANGWTLKSNRNKTTKLTESIEPQLDTSKPLYLRIYDRDAGYISRYYKITPTTSKTVYLSWDGKKANPLYPQTGPLMGKLSYIESCLNKEQNITEKDIVDVTAEAQALRQKQENIAAQKEREEEKKKRAAEEKLFKGEGTCSAIFNFLLEVSYNLGMRSTSSEGQYGKYTAAEIVGAENKLKDGTQNFIKKCTNNCEKQFDQLLKQSRTIGIFSTSNLKLMNRERLELAQERIKKPKQDFINTCLKKETAKLT